MHRTIRYTRSSLHRCTRPARRSLHNSKPRGRRPCLRQSRAHQRTLAPRRRARFAEKYKAIAPACTALLTLVWIAGFMVAGVPALIPRTPNSRVSHWRYRLLPGQLAGRWPCRSPSHPESPPPLLRIGQAGVPSPLSAVGQSASPYENYSCCRTGSR